MPVTKTDFARLLSLQDHDKLLDDLRAKINQIPVDIAALREEVAGEKARLAEAQQKTKELQVAKKDKENQMAAKEEAIRKHQGELNQVKTNEAFKALLKEIDVAKAAVGDFETAILEGMEAIDAALKEEKKAKDELARAEGENNKSVAVLEARKAELEKRLADEEGKRAGLREGIDGELFALYEGTRARRQGVGVARLVGDNCAACRVKQPPQFIVNVTKGTKIVNCDGCTRILVAAETTAAA